MERGSDFWRFSLSLYRMDGVPAACLALQDKHGLDVNLMLFALWLATQGRALEAGDMQAADAAVGGWRRESVVPLRGVRRFLRTPPDAIDAAGAQALRDRVKAAELEAERLQQEALYALRPVGDWGRAEAPEKAVDMNMDACALALGASFEAEPRGALVNAWRTLQARAAS